MIRWFVLVALALPVALAAACSSDDEDPVVVVSSPRPAGVVHGLNREPEPPASATPVQLGARPEPIAPWNGSSMMLYDIEAATARDFGFGTPGIFSPNNRNLVFARTGPFDLDGDVIVVDVATGGETPIGLGTARGWLDDRRAAFFVQDAAPTTEIVDIVSGARETTGPVPIGQPFNEQTTPDGYLLRQEFISENPFPLSRFILTDPFNGNLELLRFEAWMAKPAGQRYLVVATEPLPNGPPDARGVRAQTTNIYLVFIPSGQPAFIATSPAYPPNFPLIANDDLVAWTEDYCAPTPGSTRIFDRRTKEMRELDATLWLQDFTPDGLIAAGAFGADELIDPESLEYTAVLPPSEAQWSSDYDFASVGQVGGHGGLCP
jgi:hypothetical protein